jgi:hypothetical protein
MAGDTVITLIGFVDRTKLVLSVSSSTDGLVPLSSGQGDKAGVTESFPRAGCSG